MSVVEHSDRPLSNELGVKDFGDEDVGPPVHVQAGPNAHARRTLANQLDLKRTNLRID